MEVPGACEVAEDTMTCRSLVLSKPLAPALASLPLRRFPLVLRLPVLQRLELEIELPAGWVIDRAPRRIEAVWGEVDEELEVDGRRVRSALYLRLGAQVVDPESYPEFVRFCHAIDELGSRPPVAQRESP